MKAFIQFCSIFKQHIDTLRYEEKLRNLYKNNIDNTMLSAVCNISDIHALKLSSKLTSEITYFNRFDNEDIKVINNINNLERLHCVIFDSYFTESCIEIKQVLEINYLTPSLVIKNVFQKTIDKWKTISETIKNGK